MESDVSSGQYPDEGIGAMIRAGLAGFFIYRFANFLTFVGEIETNDAYGDNIWLWVIPAAGIVLALPVVLRNGWWIYRAYQKGPKQLTFWRSSIAAELVMSGLGAFLIYMSNDINVLYSEIAPIGLAMQALGFGFMASIRGTFIDGDAQVVHVGGLLTRKRAFSAVQLAPLEVRVRGASAGSGTFHVGMRVDGRPEQLTLPVGRDEAHRVVGAAAERTGVPTTAMASIERQAYRR